MKVTALSAQRLAFGCSGLSTGQESEVETKSVKRRPTHALFLPLTVLFLHSLHLGIAPSIECKAKSVQSCSWWYKHYTQSPSLVIKRRSYISLHDALEHVQVWRKLTTCEYARDAKSVMVHFHSTCSIFTHANQQSQYQGPLFLCSLTQYSAENCEVLPSYINWEKGANTVVSCIHYFYSFRWEVCLPLCRHLSQPK